MEKGGTRIQKVLSENGVMSRRKAEEAIAQGRVKVNGHPCKLGQKINPRKDIVALDGVNLSFADKRGERKLYIMLNKPRGYVTTTSDELGRRCVADLMGDVPTRVYPVGRLDKNSEGLLLFTNDGAFANQIMHPRGHISKTYRVTVRPDISDEQAVALSVGVEVDGKTTLPAQIHVIDKEPGRVVLQITIYEGRNRQIRKMCEAVGLEVARLRRISVGPIKLGMLAPGKWRELKPSELIALRNSLVKEEKRAEHQEGERRHEENERRRQEGGYRKQGGNRSEGGYRKEGGNRSEGGYRKEGGNRPEGGYRKEGGKRPEGGYRK